MRARAVATAALLGALAAAATAHALPDAGETGGGALDTRQTPVAKAPPEGLFTHWGGAAYDPEGPSPDDVIEGSPTPFEAELLAVDFEGTTSGFAGGTLEHPDGTKAPVIYGYREVNDDGEWSESDRFEGRGYVAAIAHLPGGRALAVGGDGDYPHREPQTSYCAEDESPPVGEDPAGKVRAWLYEGGSWRELRQRPDGTQGDELPDRMGALTAVDAYRNDGILRDTEFAVAGGLCQLWHWRDGGFLREADGSFAEPFDPTSPPEKLENPRHFSYRVREVAFATYSEDRSRKQRPVMAFAATAGCCAPDPLEANNKRAVVLGYVAPDQASEHPAEGSWGAPGAALSGRPDNGTTHYEFLDETTGRTVETGNPGPLYEIGRRVLIQTLDGDTNLGFGTGEPFKELLEEPLDPAEQIVDETLPESLPVPWPELDPRTRDISALPHHTDARPRELLPDSFYSVTASQTAGSNAAVGVVQSPGAPPGPAEPSSRIEQPPGPVCFGACASVPVAEGDLKVTSTRLLDGDGDRGGAGSPATPPVTDTLSRIDDTPDGIPDWAVGELAERGQGAVVATDPSQLPEPEPALENPPTQDVVAEAGQYRPTDVERAAAATRSYSLLELPTYRLNAIEVLDDSGQGWAVGAHGAIVQMTVDLEAAESRRTGNPEPPSLGARKVAKLGDDAPYEQARPEADPGVAGAVPSLASRPKEELDEPEVRSAGSPDPHSGFRKDVRQIVMSRDGAEGWAIGPTSGNATALHYYDGSTWSRCEAQGIAGQLPAHPACAGLAAVAEQGVPLLAAARVPLERDDDPTNDDEFEVVAIGGAYRYPSGDVNPLLLRYAKGRWRVEDAATRGDLTGNTKISDVAFTSPDDGWAVHSNAGGALLRFDGQRWASCRVLPDRCDDLESRRLHGGPADFDVEGLAVAGERLYAFGYRRVDADAGLPGGIGAGRRTYPMILYRDPVGGGWRGAVAAGGYDPAFGQTGTGGTPPEDEQGTVHSLAVVEAGPGAYEGWATGQFGFKGVSTLGAATGPPDAGLLRLREGEPWAKFQDDGALAGYAGKSQIGPGSIAMTVGRDGEVRELLDAGPLLEFDRDRERWQVVPSGRPPVKRATAGAVRSIVPDQAGGMWIAVTNGGGASGAASLYRYTDSPREPVFDEAPHPVADNSRPITDLEASPDGTVWVSTGSNALYRYDRAVGWEEIRVPGWDPGRIVTRPSAVHALAIGPESEGIAVGEGGRIARIASDAVRLDAAAGTACELLAPRPPCGTPYDLLAAAVAPDGSAIAAGERRALLWRPAGGEFRAIATPDTSVTTTFTAVAMPASDRVWLATHTGRVFAGRMGGSGSWSWSVENLDERGDPLSVAYTGELLPVNDIALDGSGRGFAVGDHGLVLERTGESTSPWRRIDTGFRDDLTSVELSSNGESALVGARNGAVITYSAGRFDVARPAEYPGTARAGAVVGVALLGGYEPGQTEAWAAIAPGDRGSNLNRVLHYTSDRAEPLLDPGRDSDPLPDARPQRSAELAFAAFGKQECSRQVERICGVPAGSNEIAEVVSRRIVEALARRDSRGAGLAAALFTGDSVDSAGLPASDRVERTSDLDDKYVSGPDKLRAWNQGVADTLEEGSLPVLGAIGAQDLSEAGACDDTLLIGGDCYSTRQYGKVGPNMAWRQAMESRGEPWGIEEQTAANDYLLEPVDDPAEGNATGPQRVEDVDIGDPDGDGGAVDRQTISAGQAQTHYAVDLVREGQPVARIVVVDSSFRSLAASDPLQQPLEPSGQMAWLERMICREGDTAANGEECTRRAGQQAIVVSNTPTYSYGPGAITETAADAVRFEALVLEHGVNAVVSGRLGWNGLYYALSAGLHEPCPGASYPEAPPSGSTPDCTGAARGTDPVAEAQRSAESLGVDSPLGLLPFVVASGGGGKFGPDGRETRSAAEGFWHGYTIVRLHPSGDPRKTIVEQRPIYDWIAVDANEHSLLPRDRVSLRGIGRGPVGVTLNSGFADSQRAGVDRIDSPAVTHRYDLLLADPDRPWLACEESDTDCRSLEVRLSSEPGTSAALAASGDADAADLTSAGSADPKAGNPCAPYLCLPKRVGTVNRQTGEVRAGDGKYPLTFAVAMLSVDERSATYPLAFKPSPSFVVTPFDGPPQIPANASPSAPAPPSLPKPQIPSLTLPTPPTLPAIPPLVAQAPPEPQPPAPPAPPPPTEQPSPLSLSVAPTGLTVATPTAVIQPPTPPVNPAPPGGARREARQRQAAAQKSGADSEEGSEAQEMGGDPADAPHGPGHASTRRESAFRRADRERPQASLAGPVERGRPHGSFTAYRSRSDSSPWATGALYGGGIGLMAAVLALGWSRGRPTPRHRGPDVAAPAHARVHSRRR